MELGLPDNDSEMSREGRLLHDYSAHPEYQREVLRPSQRDLLDSADALTKSVITQVEHETQPTAEKLEYIEQTMSLQGVGEFGTPDFVRYYSMPQGVDAALVIDRKFGFRVVERAELNLQLRVYAVLAYDFAIALDLRWPAKMFVAIAQPRAQYDERLTIASYTPELIEDSRKQIFSILKESNRPQARLIAGEEQCQDCKAKLICPAFKESMTVPAVLTPDAALSVAARTAYLEAKLAEMNDEQLAKVLEAVKLAKLVNDPVGDEVRKRIAAGAMTDFKVAKESEVRDVVNVRKALSLLSLAGLEKLDAYECVTEMSLTKLGEILRKRHPNWTWKVANDWINKKLATVIETNNRKGRILRK